MQWKKPSLNLDELAKLYWEDGMTMAEIAKKVGVGKTTVQEILRKINPAKGKCEVGNRKAQVR